MSLLWVMAAKPIPTHKENLHNAAVDMYSRHYRHGGTPPPHMQTLDEFASDRRTWWHGSPNGEAGAQVASNGLHVGTKRAAKEALEARIGRRADGADWDGSQEYGKTLLAGSRTLKERGESTSGYNCRGGSNDDHYPTGEARYGNGEPIPMHVRPSLFPVRIIGGMTNAGDPHPDWHANGYMSGQLKRRRARNGYFYKNEGEDAGSISAVVPSRSHLATHEDFVRHAHEQGWDVPQHNLERYGLGASRGSTHGDHDESDDEGGRD